MSRAALHIKWCLGTAYSSTYLSMDGSINITLFIALFAPCRGVCWNKKNKRWQAAINSSGKYLYLGSFTNEDDAARQFDRAAIKLRGKKAKLNFEYTGGTATFCVNSSRGYLWSGAGCSSNSLMLPTSR